ncbi:MAG TPA: helix-turn-helix domain-containing protein [Steroidobacteraceae bacterium]|jgi:transcriptional regulator with XRE-family HTH domain|nr:helix-turn-helix domain-containing protein [Steroidobacteraceae bacterium]
MMQVTQAHKALVALGRRLRRARLERNDSMAVFAQRLGVSEQTVRAMERGLPRVQIGTWLDALWVLDELEPLDRLLEKRESLLDLARREESAPQRRRASRRNQ